MPFSAPALLCAFLLGTGGCKTTTTLTTTPDAEGVVLEDRVVDVTLPDGQEAHLGAVLVRPRAAWQPGPIVVVVPGAGDVSRNGTRPGDGVGRYKASVDVNLRWAEVLARSGKRVLLFDKRTCGPNDNTLCKKNPTKDVDAEGPVALARDVDAACALARKDAGLDGRLVLWAHGQAVQVALASSCAKTADALVLAAPIPRAIDEVLVAALQERAAERAAAAKSEKDPAKKSQLEGEANTLKNQAATREAGFASMKKGRFSETARVDGATLGYWSGWMKLTADTKALLASTPAPKLVVVGGRDVQYGKKDRGLIGDLAEESGARLLVLPEADHHLLVDGALSEADAHAVAEAIDGELQGKPTS